MLLSRRGLLVGLTGIIAAPAIVRIDSLMKMSVQEPAPKLIVRPKIVKVIWWEKTGYVGEMKTTSFTLLPHEYQ